ncbi:MAG TPA: chemotaxis protein CheA [Anaerolineae bacterium]|nr:chemotaxis protein CheA [Anaerolineae bacterium]HIQ04368.1 chemotaxis protein CheA [Anaerolineae bacterium]
MSDTAFPVDLAEFVDSFVVEAGEHLQSIQSNLLELEAHIGEPEPNPAIINELFRSFHTIKGLAGMLGQEEIAELSHRLESLLRAVQRHELPVTVPMVDLLLNGSEVLEKMISRVEDPGQPLPDVASVLAVADKLLALRGQETHELPPPCINGLLPPDIAKELTEYEAKRVRLAQQAGRSLAIVTFTPSTSAAEAGISANMVRERLQRIGELIKVLPEPIPDGIRFRFLVTAGLGELAPLAEWPGVGIEKVEGAAAPPAPEAPGEVVPEAIPSPAEETAPAAAEKSSLEPVTMKRRPTVVRVEISRLDHLMHLIGELVVTRARLENTIKQLNGTDPGVREQLRSTADALERHIRDLREAVMRTRMVPLGEAFGRMLLVVRDLARASGKNVHLTIEGEETEIDKMLVERVMDPILHLVRNAVDHGLESPEERKRAGKSPAGTIILRGWPEGDAICIEVSDDGRGIDRAQVAERARSEGIWTDEALPDDEELLAILCHPGFSTRDVADLASGRGVGMAVVQQGVAEVGGSLSLRTTHGKGTTWTLRLPLTLAILDALIVTCGGERFVVPLGDIREVIELSQDQVAHASDTDIIPYRGMTLPLVYLERPFRLPSANQDQRHVLVTQSGGSWFGVVVDRVVAEQEIVVRAMADPLVRVPGVAAATELGDGRVALILDLPGLAHWLQAL